MSRTWEQFTDANDGKPFWVLKTTAFQLSLAAFQYGCEQPECIKCKQHGIVQDPAKLYGMLLKTDGLMYGPFNSVDEAKLYLEDRVIELSKGIT